MTESFEIQEFVKTNEPVKTIDYATGREEANKKFRKAVENRRGKAIRLIQVVFDFTSMEPPKGEEEKMPLRELMAKEFSFVVRDSVRYIRESDLLDELKKKRDEYLGHWKKLKGAGMSYKKSMVFGVLEFIEEELLGGDASKYI